MMMRTHILLVALLLVCGVSAESKTKKRGAKITQQQATATALAQVPGGSIKSSELEREGGHLIYSFDISTGAAIKEVHVDAHTGNVLAVKAETPTDEAREHKQERRERHRRRS